jgi:hypothetical protein
VFEPIAYYFTPGSVQGAVLGEIVDKIVQVLLCSCSCRHIAQNTAYFIEFHDVHNTLIAVFKKILIIPKI